MYSRDFPAACGDLSMVLRCCVSTKSHREDSLSLVRHLPMSCNLTFQPACLFFLSWNQIIFLSSNYNYILNSKYHSAITRMILSLFYIEIERGCDWIEKQHHLGKQEEDSLGNVLIFIFSLMFTSLTHLDYWLCTPIHTQIPKYTCIHTLANTRCKKHFWDL